MELLERELSLRHALFGEQALRDDADMHPHTAAVVAAGPCKLLVLYRWTLLPCL